MSTKVQNQISDLQDRLSGRRYAERRFSEAGKDTTAMRAEISALEAQVAELQGFLDAQAAYREARVQDAALRAEMDAHDDALDDGQDEDGGEHPLRAYPDQVLDQAAASRLGSGRFTREHLALCVELGMNTGSMMWYLKMRDFLAGERAWVRCTDAFMVVLARGDAGALADYRERNAEGARESAEAGAEKEARAEKAA